MINIIELIYPSVCGICGKICKDSICPKCLNVLNGIIINVKLNVKNGVKQYFDNGIGIFKYEELIRKEIIDYKFNNKAYLYKTFAKIIIKNKKTCGILKKYDIIIPVPIHKKRRKKRGYNQTELIAKELAKLIKIKYLKRVLIKQKNIVSQTLLTKSNRQKNVRGAFLLKKPELIKGKKIVLLDDIFTTGSTVNECCKILKLAGAKSIYVITIAKD